MGKTRMSELEDVILDQIEKLHDDSIMSNIEDAKVLIERSNSMSNLANSFININRTKLDIVKELNKNGTIYEKYLGIESGKT